MYKTLFLSLLLGLSILVTTQLKAQDMETTPKLSPVCDFPLGDKLPEVYSKYFIGQAYLSPLTHETVPNVPISNATFEPSCRNNWHSHTGGQILIV